MFVAPAVACEISEPPMMPRGTSCSAPGLTSFMRAALPRSSSLSLRSGDGQIVVQPLRALGADPVVERLRALVVERGLPGERRGAVRAGAIGARRDERLADEPDHGRRCRAHCVMPPNWPPVTLRTCPWT